MCARSEAGVGGPHLHAQARARSTEAKRSAQQHAGHGLGGPYLHAQAWAHTTETKAKRAAACMWGTGVGGPYLHAWHRHTSRKRSKAHSSRHGRAATHAYAQGAGAAVVAVYGTGTACGPGMDVWTGASVRTSGR